MTVIEKIQEIAESWFLREPAFYSLFCLQELKENPHIECAVRVGQGRIEYNPLVLSHLNYKETELQLRIEMIRLFLKHPYERRPEGCSGEVIALGSDCTIADGYCLLKEAGALKGPGAYHLPIGQCYEWYCKKIQENSPSPDPSHEKGGEYNENTNQTLEEGSLSVEGERSKEQQAELWQDDELKKEQINQIIERTNDWGTLPGDIVEQIQASTRARLNSSMVFQGFKSNLLSSHRILTRMRPNRRTGFLQMGSRREVLAHLLIAIDCSASIESETLSRFFALINRLFRDGNTQIDVMQFDVQILNVAPLEQVQRQVMVHGRGGTRFQPVIDYLTEHLHEYDGLMILTDGEAEHPEVPRLHAPILWVCHEEANYKAHHDWMSQSGRCCWLP